MLVQVHRGKEGSERVEKVANFLGSPLGWIVLLVVTIGLIRVFGKMWGLIVMFGLMIGLAVVVVLSGHNDPVGPTKDPGVTTPQGDQQPRTQGTHLSQPLTGRTSATRQHMPSFPLEPLPRYRLLRTSIVQI